MTSRKAWEALEKLNIILKKNNLLDTELKFYIWDLENYIKEKEEYEELVNKNAIAYQTFYIRT